MFWQLEQLLPGSGSCRGQWTPTRERLDALTSELVQLMMHLWDSCPDFARIKVGMLPSSPRPVTPQLRDQVSCPDRIREWKELQSPGSLAE